VIGRRVLLAIFGAVALAGCAAAAPAAEIAPAAELSDVADRHKDHVHRPPSPK
jgi:hypothetical protein